MKADYYELLGIAKGANDDAIRRAYRKMARKYHPDVNKEPDAESKFKEVSEAYEVLNDPQKRAVYDQYGHAGFNQGGGFGGDYGGFGDFGGLGDIFDAFFGGGQGGRSRRRGPERGADLRLDITLGFREAIFGTEKTLDIPHLERCQPCGGSGAKEGTQPQSCSQCKGAGQIQQVSRSPFGQFAQVVTCPACKGEGQQIENPCGTCRGKGKHQVNQQVKVTVPPGVDNGARLRLTGKGDAGGRGGPHGDLYIVIHVAADETLQRRDADLFRSFAISYSQAVLGADVKVPLLVQSDDPQFHDLKIPAGTQTGTVFSVRQQGVPHLNDPRRRGDLHVEIFIAVPAAVSEEERELLERLEALRTGEEKHHGGLLDNIKDGLKQLWKE